MACIPVLQEQKPVMDARRSVGVGGSSDTLVALPLPRLAGVTRHVVSSPYHLQYMNIIAARAPPTRHHLN